MMFTIGFVVFVFCCVIMTLLSINSLIAQRHARLRNICITLYCAGHWKAETVSAHAADVLWRRLRDELELPPGTATSLGLVPDQEEEYRLP